MKKTVGLLEIAKLANVSLGTVDRAMHSRGRVGKDTRKRILTIAQQFCYKPILAARALSLGSNAIPVAVCISRDMLKMRRLNDSENSKEVAMAEKWLNVLIQESWLKLSLVVLCVAFLINVAQAQDGYQPTHANLEARRWFQDAKLGMFIHWGIYSGLGDGEWVMDRRHISANDYEKVALQFNPAKFDAEQWVSLAKTAGMKYLTITSRHHDGFSMFDTAQSDWNIVARTPYGKDVLKQLADECHRQGIKLFFYYSELDWHRPDYLPLGVTGSSSGRPAEGDFNHYLGFMNAQLKELLTNYGEISGIWFDGMWDKPDADWKLGTTYSLIHQLQPAALIGSNHHKAPFPGEDFQMFEKDLPGMNTTGFGEAPISQLPLETCETMNNSWGFNVGDDHYKSMQDLVHYIARAAGNNANFLLNVGPMSNGEIQPEFVERLRALGKWMQKYGDSIYGTRGGPVAPAVWGVTTKKGHTVYVHVLEPISPTLALPALGDSVRSARLLRDGSKIEFTENSYGLLLKLPARERDEYDQVIALELGSDPKP